MADRPRTNAGGSPRDQRPERPVRVEIGAVPAAKIAAVERREASVSRGRLRRLRKLVYGARRAPRLASVEWLMRLSALRSLGFEGYQDRRTRRLTKTRAGGALACSVVIAGLDPAIQLSSQEDGCHRNSGKPELRTSYNHASRVYPTCDVKPGHDERERLGCLKN